MRDIIIPNIIYPFPERISPFANEVQKHVNAFEEQLNLLPNGGFKAANLGKLAARVAPDVELESLCLLSEYFLLFFVLKDLYSDKTEDKNELDRQFEKIVGILKGKEVKKSMQDLYLIGWGHWWRKIQTITDLEWQNRFINRLIQFFNSLIWEVNNRKNKKVPNLESYSIYRQYTGGILPCVDLMEVFYEIKFPVNYQSDLLNDLIGTMNNIINWSNDIISLRKELANGALHNLIFSLQQHEQISIQEALIRAKEMHDLELDRYFKLENLILEQNTSDNDSLKKYIISLRAVIRGNLDWSMNTSRY